jgi:adenylylsulfate kinase
MRQAASPQRGLAVWFTGLSGAGKTTLCRALEPELRALGYSVHVLDSDEIRQHLNRDLGYSKADRDKNVLRLGGLARTLVRQGAVVLVAAISPYREARSRVREDIGSILEVYVNAPVETCIQRDPKRLYARALAGEIRSFTGIDDPYEPPLEPDVQCNTEVESCEESMRKVLAAIRNARQGVPIDLIEAQRIGGLA